MGRNRAELTPSTQVHSDQTWICCSERPSQPGRSFLARALASASCWALLHSMLKASGPPEAARNLQPTARFLPGFQARMSTCGDIQVSGTHSMWALCQAFWQPPAEPCCTAC